MYYKCMEQPLHDMVHVKSKTIILDVNYYYEKDFNCVISHTSTAMYMVTADKLWYSKYVHHLQSL